MSNEIFKFVVTFCMKSGNTFNLYCDNFEYEKQNSKISSWKAVGCDTRHISVNLDEVEFVYFEDWNKPKGKITNK